MKGQRGKKAKYVKYAEKGLLKDGVWKKILQSYPTTLIEAIRHRFIAEIPNLNEKFNTNSRYFGYWQKNDIDKAYIYIRKKDLIIDLCIDTDYAKDIRKHGFKVRPRDNFQGQSGWLTGWLVLHSTSNVESVMKWLCRAFDKNL